MPKKTSSKTLLAFGDVHIPYQHSPAVEIVCRVAEAIEPDLIVCLGDLLDCGQFSTHPPTYGVAETDYQDDLQKANAFLDRLQETCGRLVLVEGNHEYRIDRWAAGTSEGRGAYNMLAPRLQLMRGRKRCTYIPYGSTDGKYPHYKINSRIIAVHGWSYARHATKAHLTMSQGKSVIHGHTHRADASIIQNIWHSGQTVQSRSTGCLCKPIPLYGTGRPVEWINAFLVGYLGRRSDSFVYRPDHERPVHLARRFGSACLTIFYTPISIMNFTLRPYQQESVHAVYDHLRTRDDNPCVVLPTGCHAADHAILMYDGTIRKVQDVQVGDLVMGDDSTPRRVLALCRGRERMYRIVPHRGEPFIVNENHILSLVSTNEGKSQHACCQRGGEITNISVREYMQKAKSWRHLRKLYRVPVDYSASVDLPIPPYILGLLLGGGCLANGVALTSADEELGEELIRYAQSLGCDVRVNENSSGVPAYHLIYRKGASNPVIAILEQLGLYGHLAESKFIPRDYLVSGRDARLQLLAGLLDSDGYYTCGGFDYITKSRELSGDIAQLARSLGFRVTITEKYCSCQTGAGGWYFRLNISGDSSVVSQADGSLSRVFRARRTFSKMSSAFATQTKPLGLAL